ncbi:hypothetical protein ACP70R_015811 [Stipagrostis hirtigluma subsp. patula]
MDTCIHFRRGFILEAESLTLQIAAKNFNTFTVSNHTWLKVNAPI